MITHSISFRGLHNAVLLAGAVTCRPLQLLKSNNLCSIINLINLNLAVNFHSTIGLILLTKPMVGVFSPLNYLY